MPRCTETEPVRSQNGRDVRVPTSSDAWLSAWGIAWGITDLPSRVRIEYSYRLRRSLGRCFPAQGFIRLHHGLQDVQEAVLREVICHEAAHIATWTLYEGRSKSHGSEWRDLMLRAGYQPRARWVDPLLSQVIWSKSTPIKLYDHRCPVCGAHWVARKRVTYWRCGECRDAGLEGLLEIVPLSTSELVAQ